MTTSSFMTCPTVAAFLDSAIRRSAKTQIQIARECAFPAPNIITMIKQGHTKLPLAKVGAVAKALDLDPAHLLRLALREYLPDTYDAIESVLSPSMLTANEMSMINAYRRATAYSDPEVKVVMCEGIVAITPHWR